MYYELNWILLTIALFAGLLALHELGRRLGARRVRLLGGDKEETGVIDGAVFALLGLLIAFTFSGAASRFDDRRAMIVDEANAIGTAYLRLDVLPAAAQPQLREVFRRYLDARLAAYRLVPDIAAAKAELARAVQIQGELWAGAVAAAAGSQQAMVLVLPALNDTFDIAAKRTAATEMHPPTVIFVLLIGLALLSAMLAGYAMARSGRRPWLHTLTFAFMLGGAVYVIFDLEYPRVGLIRVDDFDQLLVDVRQSMK
jgi:hypothetical protein